MDLEANVLEAVVLDAIEVIWTPSKRCPVRASAGMAAQGSWVAMRGQQERSASIGIGFTAMPAGLSGPVG